MTNISGAACSQVSTASAHVSSRKLENQTKSKGKFKPLKTQEMAVVYLSRLIQSLIRHVPLDCPSRRIAPSSDLDLHICCSGVVGRLGVANRKGSHPGRMRALLSTSSCRFCCLSRQVHVETSLSRTKLTWRVIDVADVWLEGVVGKRGLVGARRQCCTLVCSQDRLRSRLISAARLGRSFSLTALNFNPSPPPGLTCRTTALA